MQGRCGKQKSDNWRIKNDIVRACGEKDGGRFGMRMWPKEVSGHRNIGSTKLSDAIQKYMKENGAQREEAQETGTREGTLDALTQNMGKAE